ncbi:hypothetical protein Mp_5g12060 [Marchantia polymorpha subsp. ruderalis]|nr:hypothetical protein MARPO_0143s0035 [Marchantia polymorpha]BBN11461.1 hypothetical protein Mp_5g12060 [Marchantia polymorpha subsp. ruderalis]|eukprot:PTQ29360.1 hypothetical protein MARPO_0143s0035 [Marchantia polymorpha]
MRGLRNAADFPEPGHNWKPYSAGAGGAGRGGGLIAPEQHQQPRGGGGGAAAAAADERVGGWRDRRRSRDEYVANGANSFRNPRLEGRGVAGGGSSRGRFEGRDRHGIRGPGDEKRPRGSRSRPVTDEYRYWCSAVTELPDVRDKFVMVSYNILADKNAAEHYNGLYYHIPWRLMNWVRRKSKIVHELGLWSPDVMCLQEVDQYEDIREEFEKRGYQGTYKGRTGGALDGCAIFWRSSRFRLLDEQSIQFDTLGLRDNVAQLCALQSIGVRENMPSNIEVDLPDSGSSGNVVIVGNIHVLFNPKRGDIKLGQVRVLLESAHALSQKWGEAPVVIGGDFNSTPSSSIYQYLAKSELDISCLSRLNLSGQVEANDGGSWNSQGTSGRCLQPAWENVAYRSVQSNFAQSLGPVVDPDFVSFSEITTNRQEYTTWSADGTEMSPAESRRSLDSPLNKLVKVWHWTPEELTAATGSLDVTTVRHNLRLRSAYTEIEGEVGCRDPQGEPLVTTYHKKFMGTVDYIWHTEGLDTVKVLDTLPVNVLQRCQGLPSQKWGSDHLALACELAFHPSGAS